MKQPPKLRFDTIGYWTEFKLDIIREYAAAYSRILSRQRQPALYHIYVDAFAGAGIHISRTTGKSVKGSPLNALEVKPPFREYHFIDLDSSKVSALEKAIGARDDVFIYEGDCNRVLLNQVFPKVRYADYRRALCLLDPYGLHLDWELIKVAGQLRTIDLFLNFPVADMNRNVLWRNPECVPQPGISRMNRFWGDDSWRDIAYSREKDLFGYPEKEDNETIASAFRERLINVATFGQVADPIPMRNKQGSTIYYLFFASQKPVGKDIIEDIFKKYRNKGVR